MLLGEISVACLEQKFQSAKKWIRYGTGTCFMREGECQFNYYESHASTVDSESDKRCRAVVLNQQCSIITHEL